MGAGSTAFEWTHASWDNATKCILPRRKQIGWRRGGDGSSAVVRREKVACRYREKSNLRM
jgi:hypothetical protein